MNVQSSRSPAGTISGLHFGSPNKMCHLDVASIASCRKYYIGEGGGFPRVRAVVNLVCPSARGLSQHPRVSRRLNCRNPTLAKCRGEAQHLEKLGIWSPPGLPNVQSSTKRGKTPCIGMLLVSLKRS
jgi:hypothetical protein